MDALREGGAGLGPPLVVPVPVPPRDPHPDLGPAHQRQLEKLIGMRRSVAEAATACMRVKLQIDQLEERAARLGGQHAQAHQGGDTQPLQAEFLQTEQSSTADQLADLRRRHTDLQAGQARLLAVARDMQHELDVLRQEAPPDNPPGLQELRPGAPAWSGLRVLFGVEPPATAAHSTAAPATAVLLAASTERDWLRAWYTTMIPRSQARYERDQRGTG